MPKPEQVPAAVSSGAQSPVTELVETGTALSGAELAAAFSRGRKATPSPNPAPAPDEEAEPLTPLIDTDQTPGDDENADPDDTNAAPAPETTPEAEAEPEPEDEQEQEQAPEESKGIKGLQKRNKALTARLRDTERQLAELKNGAPKPAASPAPPQGEFGHDPEVQQLNHDIGRWQRMRTWTRENPQGGEIHNDKGEVIAQVTQEQAQAMDQQAEEQLDDLKMQRQVCLRELRKSDTDLRRQNEELVGQRFPWTKVETDQRSEFIRSLVQTVPELKRIPGWKLYAAHAIEGFLAAAKSGKPGALAAPANRPPKVGIPGTSAAQRVDPARKEMAEAVAAFEKSGSEGDFKRVQILRRQAARQKG